MAIVDEVAAQLKEAMLARDKDRTNALRNIKAALLLVAKEAAGSTVSDEQAMTALRALAKQRLESIEGFVAGGRADAAAAERFELAVIEGFLPKLADEAMTRAWAQEAIALTGATSAADIGKVMGKLMAGHKAELDGKLANKVVRELLS